MTEERWNGHCLGLSDSLEVACGTAIVTTTSGLARCVLASYGRQQRPDFTSPIVHSIFHFGVVATLPFGDASLPQITKAPGMPEAFIGAKTGT